MSSSPSSSLLLQYRSGIYYHDEGQKAAAEKKFSEINAKLAVRSCLRGMFAWEVCVCRRGREVDKTNAKLATRSCWHDGP